GCGLWSSSAFADMIMPLMQYPHCTACKSMKACCSGCGWATVPSPSSVVPSDCPIEPTSVTQERTGWPSTSTVQAPHCDSPQPNLALLSSRSLRSTYSSGVSGSAGTLRTAPLTLRLTAMGLSPWYTGCPGVGVLELGRPFSRATTAASSGAAAVRQKSRCAAKSGLPDFADSISGRNRQQPISTWVAIGPGFARVNQSQPRLRLYDRFDATADR